MSLIQCRNCGHSISDKAERCPKCGAPVEHIINCPECGEPMHSNDKCCPNCGCPRYKTPSKSSTDDVFSNGPSGKSRGVAALLAVFLGSIGAHYFYLGKNTAGVINILLVFLGWILVIPPLFVGILTIIQCILMFTMSQEEFEQRYVYTNKTYPL